MHLPLRLQTTSRSDRKHHSEELAQTQTCGLEEGIDSAGVKPDIRGQFMNIKLGMSEEERTVFSRNSERKTGHLHGRTSLVIL